MPTLQQKRGTSAALAAVNPTPLAGEIVWVSDTNTLRVGDGVTAYSSLSVVSATPTDGSVTTAKLANDAVTYAKLQNVSATDRLLGRSSAGAGDVEEITCTAFGRSLIDDADAAAARTTLSVQPTASPAFTGAATFANTGNVVPLTITNTGTANSFVVNDASGDTSPFVIDASGNVGIGTSSPAAALDVGSGNLRFSSTAQRITGDFSNSTISNRLMFQTSTSNGNTSVRAITNGTATTSNFAAHNGSDANNTSFIAIQANPTETIVNSGSVGTGTNLPLTFYTGGVAQVQISTGGQLLVTAGSASAPGVAFSGDTNTGEFSPAADNWAVATGGTERVRIDASGNVGIGVSPSYRLHLSGNYSGVSNIGVYVNNSGGASTRIALQDTATTFAPNFGSVGNAITFDLIGTERLRIDADGNVRVNGAAAATSAVGAIHIRNGTAPTASILDGVVLFAADVSSSSELRVRDEAGNTTTLSPHAFPLIPDGPSEPMAWAYYSERDGRRINVDMLRVVRLLEQLTGEKLVYED